MLVENLIVSVFAQKHDPFLDSGDGETLWRRWKVAHLISELTYKKNE